MVCSKGWWGSGRRFEFTDWHPPPSWLDPNLSHDPVSFWWCSNCCARIIVRLCQVLSGLWLPRIAKIILLKNNATVNFWPGCTNFDRTQPRFTVSASTRASILRRRENSRFMTMKQRRQRCLLYWQEVGEDLKWAGAESPKWPCSTWTEINFSNDTGLHCNPVLELSCTENI
jgi:hypothetical protein